jgi:tetratricopeptide (TPR) repeat protein
MTLPALVAVILYANTLGNAPVYDDRWTLSLLDEVFRMTWWDLLWSPRGLTYTVHRIDDWLWQGWSAGWHLTNLVLHSGVSLLAAYVALRLTSSRRTATLCGLLFAAHPVHVEAVASIAYRKDLLAAGFVLLAVVFWHGSHRLTWRYFAALACVVLGLQAKEVAAIGVVPMLFLSDLLPGAGRKERLAARFLSAIKRSLPVLLLGLLVAVSRTGDLREYFEKAHVQEEILMGAEGYGQVLATSLAAVPKVSELLLFPTTLSVDYPTRLETSLLAWRPIFGALIVACWILLCLLLARRSPVAAFAAAWTLITYLPCSNILPLTHFFVAERYLYTPSFGVCLLAAIAVDRALDFASSRGRGLLQAGVAVGCLVLFLTFAARTVGRNSDWRDSYTIWSSAVRDGVRTARVYNNLGLALFQRGETGAAILEFRRAVRLEPRDSAARLNLANALLISGEFDSAESMFRATLAIAPDSYRAYHGLAVCLSKRGKTVEAVDAELRAIGIHPGYADGHYWLGVLLARQGKLEESLPYLTRSVEIRPDDHDGHKALGEVLLRLGRADEAAVHLEKASRLRPDEADTAPAPGAGPVP